MNFTMYILLSLILPILILLGIVIFKMINKKEIPDSRFTPFDYITGQSTVQFHEEKEEKEEQDEHGDDKDKNIKKKKF